MELNFTKQDWQKLWCTCDNRQNLSFEADLKAVHENIWIQGLLYVVCVVCLYTTGVIAILFQSGFKFRSSSGSFCIDQIMECHDSIRRKRKRRRAKLRKDNDIELESVAKDTKEKPVIKVTKDRAILQIASTSMDDTSTNT